MMPLLPCRIVAMAALIATVGSAWTARADMTGVISSNGAQSVALAYSGNMNIEGITFSGSIITDTFNSLVPSTLTFSYSGVDYTTGLRPILDFTNNTGTALTSLTFSLGTAGTSFYGFADIGPATINPPAFSRTGQAATGGTLVTVPFMLAAGATEAIYLPVDVTATSGSFTLTVAPTPSTVPEPASLTMLGMATVAGLGYWGRKRRQANSA